MKLISFESRESARNTLSFSEPPESYPATILVTLLLAVPAISVELFRYRYQDRDGGEYEFSRLMNKVRARPKTKKRRKKLRWPGCRVFYGEQIGTIESQELKTEVWGRRGKESNLLVLVLQTNTLPLGYPDVLSQYRKSAIIL
jgi:hypothetical protein